MTDTRTYRHTRIYWRPPTLCDQTDDIDMWSILLLLCLSDPQYEEDDDEITPDLWQEACWIVIR